jgi:hypothetical protein
MDGDERLAVAEARDRAVEVLADRLAEQRGRPGAVRVRAAGDMCVHDPIVAADAVAAIR